jgi:hypothetical protein
MSDLKTTQVVRDALRAHLKTPHAMGSFYCAETDSEMELSDLLDDIDTMLAENKDVRSNMTHQLRQVCEEARFMRDDVIVGLKTQIKWLCSRPVYVVLDNPETEVSLFADKNDADEYASDCRGKHVVEEHTVIGGDR